VTTTGVLLGGRYRLGEPIGSGAGGAVWDARDELLQRDVAIKQVRYRDDLADDERARLVERTAAEARAVAAIDTAAAVRIFDIVESEDGCPWIVMERLRGHTLQELLDSGRSLPSPEVARIGLCVLEALEAAARVGVVHGDVRPGNVICGTDGRIALTAFGVATIDDSARSNDDSYLAPERTGGAAATEASDLWSLGATLWAAVEGKAPQERPTPACADCSPALQAVLTRLLATDPAQRPPYAEVRAMLEDAGRALRLAARTEPAQPRQARTWPLVAAIVAVLVVTSVLLSVLMRPPSAGSARSSGAPTVAAHCGGAVAARGASHAIAGDAGAAGVGARRCA
jgi:serine/threonine protein kinase